ncbi:pyridine nucleotide-disulfide oxidoreductase domain-containing protein 2-like [Paramacrobiotus metropolitanus]|uniref:pyridine nucleotide-disulfide oxidoreductase domain-containing protein 2-like n=1 Tax=Paramacrobiotus metropolitanus TaxID=2943436 RepID=UPI0024464118|nr:pyridine nucleotide-disulfide oxidoreductase domain-containing protein 2-like [Paramacrobiotus metropolitanus]XP_055342685.1 pyridine nucleotide-disulfide oxidoreductase domain-containing protein 2-like [Paramacrobiotus metropolitanus]
MLRKRKALSDLKKRYDAVVVGGGHNGLVAACYLRNAGLDVAVLEQRPVIGGAAVTEEIVPGFKFSRASYLLSLLRPVVYNDLDLKKHGLKLHFRNPYSFTPMKGSTQSLLLGTNHQENHAQISKFSAKDADNFIRYEALLNQIVDAIDPLFDIPPPSFAGRNRRKENYSSFKQVAKTAYSLRKVFPETYELLTAPISKVLKNWFESEPLRATLATDGLIGSSLGPHCAGTGYVLLHHVMGRLENRPGAWAYVEGGMGAVSETIGNVLEARGGHIFTNAKVTEIATSADGVRGIRLATGEEIQAPVILSNATVRKTFQEFLPNASIDSSLRTQVDNIDYASPVVKINVALSRIPDFSKAGNKVLPHHQCSIHLNCESIDILDDAYKDFVNGKPSKKPMIEMVIPSSLDHTISPPGAHVALLFVQYLPYGISAAWSETDRNNFAKEVFKQIDDYAPGFTTSVLGYEVLTPHILEQTFGLTGGNIFHGSLNWDQLFFSRPLAKMTGYRTPVKGLYLCGSGCHPGGGVTGAPGRLSAQAVLNDLKKK